MKLKIDSWPMSALINLILPHIERGPWLEFGVARGATIRQLAKHTLIIYGFDSFQGLPEDWKDESGGLQEPKGKFKCDRPTDLPDNVILVEGLFQDTLQRWIREWIRGPNDSLGFVHIDCDLYSSTKFVLEQLEPYLDRTVIAFDEIGPFPAGAYHEGRAWNEFRATSRYGTQYIGQQHTAGAIYKLYRH